LSRNLRGDIIVNVNSFFYTSAASSGNIPDRIITQSYARECSGMENVQWGASYGRELQLVDGGRKTIKKSLFIIIL
jgi:hypothetical protein